MIATEGGGGRVVLRMSTVEAERLVAILDQAAGMQWAPLPFTEAEVQQIEDTVDRLQLRREPT